MKRWFRATWLLCLVAPLSALAQTAPTVVLGNIPIRCGTCHLDRIIPTGGQGGVNFLSLRRESAGDEGLCFSCHNGVVVDSRDLMREKYQHPTGVKPRQPDLLRQAGFPLDEQGNLFCGSCHTPHDKGKRVFIRYGDDGPALCLRCHGALDAGPKRGAHPLALIAEGKISSGLQVAGSRLGPGQRMTCITCHRPHGASYSFLLLIKPWGKDGLCQSCHGDGPQKESGNPPKPSHPVNVKAERGPGMEWTRDGLSLSPDGMVDCWGCHRAHRGADGSSLVARDLTKGSFCVRCHEKEDIPAPGKGNHPIASAQAKPDATQATCQTCHRFHNAAPGDKNLLAFDRDKADLCRSCHAAVSSPGPNHPLGGVCKGPLLDRLEKRGAFFGPGKTVLCTTCHRLHGADQSTPGLVAEEKMLCLFCHQEENALDAVNSVPGTHPILMQIKNPLPAEVTAAGGRLSSEGEIMCTTCHRVHGARSSRAGLIMEAAAFDCLACHRAYEKTLGGRHNLAVSSPKTTNRFGETPAKSGACRACHTEHGWARETAPGEADLVSRLCLSCHDPKGPAAKHLAQDVSHPLGVSPWEKKMFPGRLPLFDQNGRRVEKGVVSCATCHQIHDDGGEDNPFYLRLPLEGRKFLCVQCHQDKALVINTRHDLTLTAPDEKNLRGTKPNAGGICSSCHTAHGGFERTMWARIISGEGDLSTQFCVSCHNRKGVAKKGVPGAFSHPIGELGTPETVVRVVKPREKGKQIERRSAVTCASCHDPHRWDPEDERNRGEDQKAPAAVNFLKARNDIDSTLCVHCHPNQGVLAGTLHDLRRAPGGGPIPCSLVGGDGSFCGQCHRVHTGEGPYGWPKKLSGKDDAIATICLTCHSKGGCAEGRQLGQFGHPTRITPVGYRSERLPLFDGQGRKMPAGRPGNVTCATCHEVHASETDGPPLVDEPGEPLGRNPSFLRLVTSGAAPLCTECHADESLVNGSDHDLRVTDPRSQNLAKETPAISGSCGACHAVHNPPSTYRLWNRSMGPGYDLVTSLCTSCHAEGQAGKKPERYYVHWQGGRDDILAPRKTFNLKKGGVAESGKPPLPLYSQDGQLGSRGLITCATCHNVHRWDPSQAKPGRGMAVEGDGSNSFLRLSGSFALMSSFCAECHIKDAVQKYQDFHFPEGKSQ